VKSKEKRISPLLQYVVIDKLAGIFINLIHGKKTNNSNKRLEKGVYLGKRKKKNFVGGRWFGSGF